MTFAGLAAFDPGGLRRAPGSRAAAAVLTTWITLRWLVEPTAGPSAVAFGIAISFVGSLIILDPRRHDRQVTMLLAVPATALAIVVAAALDGAPVAFAVVLLALIFTSFAARRLGLRAGELTLLAAMSAYFAANTGAGLDRVGWFALAAAIGIAWMACWQFLLVPFRPERGIQRAVDALLADSRQLVESVRGSAEHPTTSTSDADDERPLRRIRTARQVIESQFPGVLAPTGWTTERVGRMQLALYELERGLTQLVESEHERTHHAAPPAIAASLVPVLRALEGCFDPDPTRRAAATAEFDTARRLARQAARPSMRVTTEHGESPPAPWIGPLVRKVRAATRIADAVGHLRVDGQHTAESNAPTVRHAAPVTPVADDARGPRPHPTTALGLQAVVATGTAMAIAAVAGADHAEWIFWSAFVVIAGSAGESVRRTAHRVGGTVGGAAGDALVALMAPDGTLATAAIVAGAVFGAVFFAPVSYAVMVGWLNLGFVVLASSLEAPTWRLFFERSITALVGALIAATVALVVLPVRTSRGYRRAVASLLDDADQVVTTWTAVTIDGADATGARAATHHLEVSAARAARLLPAVAFESNPMMQSRSSLRGQDLQLAATVRALRRFAEECDDPSTSLAPTALVAVAGRIHANLTVFADALRSGTRPSLQRPLDDLATATPTDDPNASAPDSALWALIGVHRAVVELAESLGLTISNTRTERSVVS